MTKPFILPPPGSLAPADNSDPLPFYYRPLIGALYKARLDVGLQMLPERCDSLLEIGYGSGILMPSLAARCNHLFGVDIHSKNLEVGQALQRLGITPTLLSHDARQLPFSDGRFDVIVAFSFLEHVKPLEPFLKEMWRVLRTPGHLILGMPMVNKLFNRLFPLIGFSGIEDHHISSPPDLVHSLKILRWEWTERGMPAFLPSALRFYRVFHINKRDDPI